MFNVKFIAVFINMCCL